MRSDFSLNNNNSCARPTTDDRPVPQLLYLIFIDEVVLFRSFFKNLNAPRPSELVPRYDFSVIRIRGLCGHKTQVKSKTLGEVQQFCLIVPTWRLMEEVYSITVGFSPV